MAVRLLKDVLAEKVKRATTINFPDTVVTSYCHTYTKSVVQFTSHGIVRLHVTQEVNNENYI